MSLTIDHHLPDAAWDAFVERRADGHVLQTSAWARLKSRFGWSAGRVAVLDEGRVVAGASVLFRRLPLGLGTLAYVPKGPVVNWDNAPLVSALFGGLDALCRARRAFALKLELDIEENEGGQTPVKARSLAMNGESPPFAPHSSLFALRPSSPVQPRRTALIDLTKTEDELLAAMHQKTRYNIRLAARKRVVVRPGTADDLPALYALMQTTGERDGFGVHSPEYYRAAFEIFVPHDWARLFVAEVHEAGIQKAPVAAIMVFAFGSKAWYMYGASGNEHRERMPNHALQWEAIRWTKSQGCATYDLWGVPDEGEATLDAQYLERSDGLWGVYRFKRGFGGRLVRYVGAFDRVYDPLLYRVYLFALQRRGGMAL
jgi:lipid II:glycine glycyltransferase (peptidoglycan interpeptide bridge formation enzyme)